MTKMRASHTLPPWLLLLGVVTVGCGLLKKTPPAPVAPPITIAAPAEAKVKASMALSAGVDVNPDRNGRASPVLVRVYQLKAEGAFNDAQFEPLYDDDRKVLADAFVTREEFTVSPGEKRMLEVVLADETRFVGVVAAFRDVANAEWRAIVPAPRKGLTVMLAGKRVAMSPTE